MKKLSDQPLVNDMNAAGTSERITWHSAFYEALQMELREYRNDLDFRIEFQLTSEPLRIDCVIIKKTKDVEIKKNIAAIFRGSNLLEYKKPGDYVSVADFYKVYAYACLYASFENAPIKDLTLSFVQSRFPRKLINHLQNERGYTIAETAGGIYTVEGDMLPIQIIDSRRLSADENLWLKSLSDRLNTVEIARIGKEITRQKKGARITAYLNVIAEANSKSIKEAMEMSQRKHKITLEQVMIDCGLAARLETNAKVSIAQNLVNMGFPFETVVSATQLEPKKVKALYNAKH